MKDLSKSIIVSELLATLKLVKAKPSLLVIASFLDALFFVAYGFFTAPVSEKITEHSILLGNKVSMMIAQGTTGVLMKLFEAEHRMMTGKLILLILLMFVVTYFVYCIFHGTSWYIAQKMAGKKYAYRAYFAQFVKLNLIWMAGCVVYKLLDVVLSLRYQIVQKFAPNALNVAGSALVLLFLIWVFAALQSYATLKTWQVFKTPLKITIPLMIFAGAVNSLPVFVGPLSKTNIFGVFIDFIVNGSFVGTLQFLLNQVSKLNTDGALIVGIITLFPLLVTLKVYVIRVMTHVHTRD